MSIPTLTISAQLAREPLPVTGERQIAFLLLEVRANDIGKSPGPVNLGFVLDRSGSMRGPRLQYLKAAIGHIIDQMQPEDLFSVVTFDDRVDLVVPSGPVTDATQAKSAIEVIEEGGGTVMSLGISLGLAEMQRHQTPAHASRLILVTDGVTRGDDDHCVDLARQAGATGIPIAPIGMGAEWDDTFLDLLAEASGGPPSTYIRTPVEVGTAFGRQLHALRKQAAREVMLVAHFVAGVVPRRVSRVTPYLLPLDEAISGDAIHVRLGDIERDSPQIVLVELLIEPKKGGTFRIAQVETTYPGPDGTAIITRADVVVTFTGSATKPPQLRPIVVHYLERVNAARIVLRALQPAQPEDHALPEQEDAREPKARWSDTHAGRTSSGGLGFGKPAVIAPAVVALFDGESREAIEHLRQGIALSPEERKLLLARVREIALVRRPTF